MNTTQIIILIISIILLSTMYMIQRRNRKIRKLEEEWILQMQLDVLRSMHEDSYRFYSSKIGALEEAIVKYKSLTNEETGYLSNYDMNHWKATYSKVFEETKESKHRHFLIDTQIITILEDFFEKYENFSKLRTAYNKTFVKN